MNYNGFVEGEEVAVRLYSIPRNRFVWVKGVYRGLTWLEAKYDFYAKKYNFKYGQKVETEDYVCHNVEVDDCVHLDNFDGELVDNYIC